MDETFLHIPGILSFSYCETRALNLPYLSISDRSRNPDEQTQHRQQHFSHYMGDVGIFIRLALKIWET